MVEFMSVKSSSSHPAIKTPPKPLDHEISSSFSSSLLPSDFQPCFHTVVIGKGRLPSQATGNRRLKQIVRDCLMEYAAASTKMAKTKIVSSIFVMINEACDELIGFVKCDRDGRFWIVSEHQARDKIASTFRDCLHERYKSSSKNKVAKRRQARRVMREQRNLQWQLPRQQRIAPQASANNEKRSMEQSIVSDVHAMDHISHSSLYNDNIDSLALSTPKFYRISTFSISTDFNFQKSGTIEKSIFDFENINVPNDDSATMTSSYFLQSFDSVSAKSCSRSSQSSTSTISLLEDHTEDEVTARHRNIMISKAA